MGQWDFLSEKEKKNREKNIERSNQKKKKYALLTPDLRTAAANKKIVGAEQQLRTLINSWF